MLYLLNFLNNLLGLNFSMQVTPAYDAASKHMASKTGSSQDMFVFIVFGIIAVVFIIFLVFVYFKERNKPRLPLQA